MAVVIVWRSRINPKDKGWLRNTKIIEKVHLIMIKNNRISGNSLN